MASFNRFTDCPICLDTVEGHKNQTITDCGHCFHTSCLMTSVAHNGFACPYCRTKMADEVEEEESDYDDEEDEVEVFDDDALRGFRMFMNNVDGDAHDEEDLEEENVYEENNAVEEPAEESTAPSASFIAEKLTHQGVTMEDLVKILLIGHDEYDHQNEELERCDNDIFGRLRIIISNYNPQ